MFVPGQLELDTNFKIKRFFLSINREMAEQVRTLAALVEDLCLISSIQEAHNHL